MTRPFRADADVYLGALFSALLAVLPVAVAAQEVVAAPDEDLAGPGSSESDTPSAPDVGGPPPPSADAPGTEVPPSDEAPASGAPDTTLVPVHSGITGVVVDASTGETMIEAPVIVVGGSRVFTDYDGNFSIDLPPGTYDIRSYYDYYRATRIHDIRVRRGERTEIRIELVPESGMEADEVIIEVRADTGSTATALRTRRESLAVQDGVSAEEIRRSPDSDASEAARRIVGATIVDGQYLFVRGLGGRYTSVLLNGAYLPSSDPDQPGVQLDLFPSAILNSLTIAKTFTPDLPGDSAGGTLMIATREYPAHFTFGMSLTLGANTASTFSSAPMGTGGETDFLGYDDGGRSTPGAVSDRLLVANPEYEPAEYLADSRSFSNRWGIRDGLVGPNGSLSLNFGDTLLVGSRRLGYFISLSYGNRSQVYRNELVGGTQLLTDDEGNPIGASPLPGVLRDSFQNSVSWGGLGAFEFELTDEDTVSLTLLWSQNSDSYTGRGDSYDPEIDRRLQTTRLQWVERTMYFGQLRGDHRGLPFGMSLNWSLSGSYSARNEPDTRDLSRSSDVDGGAFVWAQVPGSGRRIFLSLGSAEIDGNLNIAIPIETATVRVGGALRANQRDFSFRRFTYRRATRPENPDFELLPPEDLFSEANLGPNVMLTEETGGNDGYRASQSLGAAYGMLDWPVWDWVRIVGGARVESFRQTVDPSLPFGENIDDARTVRRTDLDVLGSAGLIFTLTPDMFVRASYGTTVARPQIRELAAFVYPDFVRGRDVFGNPGLERTRIDNADLRWEYFLSPDEVIAVSGFFKNFESPIEMITFGNRSFGFRNVEGAINAGVELEARFSLGRFTDVLRHFDFAGNFTWVHSEVRLGEAQRGISTSLSRPLAGQSPYVVNLSLGLDIPEASGLLIRVFYNVFGERLIEAGTMMSPDIYQQPFHSFDVTAAVDLPANLGLRLAVENIFVDDYLLTQGGAVVQQYNGGLTASLSLSWRPE